jgi:hypothetical protein
MSHFSKILQAVEDRFAQYVIIGEGIVQGKEDGNYGKGYESKQPRADERIA